MYYGQIGFIVLVPDCLIGRHLGHRQRHDVLVAGLDQETVVDEHWEALPLPDQANKSLKSSIRGGWQQLFTHFDILLHELKMQIISTYLYSTQIGLLSQQAELNVYQLCSHHMR